jgi:hypothetical protein
MNKKTTILSTLCFLLFAVGVNAQTPPNAFNYSAVARNAVGQPIATTAIGIQISILKTSPTGASQYSENHFVNTDAFGLFNLIIGAGAVQSGSIATIDWSNDNYYLKVGMDATGGTNFLTMGTTQLLSVPYAMYAKSAGSVSGGTDITITSVSSSGDTLYLSNGQKFVSGGNSVGASLVLPTITTKAVTGITSNSATFGGSISNANGNQIMERGIVYSTSPNPTLASNKIVIGNGIGTFDTITSMNFQYPHFLQPNTAYYVRAYAVTENNISAYGNEVNFTTSIFTPPIITTNTVTGITSNSATFGGVITNANGNQILERGIQISTTTFSSNVIISNTIQLGNGIGSFDTIIGLDFPYYYFFKPNTTYYVRACASLENGYGACGNEVSFTTLSVGQTGPGGGIVFFNKGNANGGWQYLECAASDQSTGIPWGCNGTSISGTQLTVGSGEANTSLIVAGCNESSFAAKLCNDLILGGKSDWFLPSIDELNLMYRNLDQNGQGNFTFTEYWSSTQSNYNGTPWVFQFNGGYYIDNFPKLSSLAVRAIRAF